MRKLLLCLVTAVAIPVCGSVLAASADFPEYRFHRMPETSYYGGIHSITKDTTGRIWFSGADALFVYDGTDFVRMDMKISGTLPGSKWTFGKVVSDDRGDLFVATNRALFKYSDIENSFAPVLSGNISSVDLDADGSLWYIRNGCLETIADGNRSRTILSSDIIPKSRQMTVICSGSNVYLACDGILFKLDIQTGECSSFIDIDEPGCTILDVLEFDDHVYILTIMHGVYRCDSSGKVDTVYTIPGLSESSGMKELYLDDNGIIWAATQKGIMLIDPETGDVGLVQSDLHYAYSLPNNSVWTFFGDQDGGVWVGMYGGKLAYTSAFDDGVNVFKATPGGLDHPIVSCFEEDSRGNLWIGTEGGGLNFWNREKGEYVHYTAENGSGLASNMIKKVRYSADSSLLVATYNGGLMKYSPSHKKFVKVGNDFPKIVYDFLTEGTKGLWMSDPDGDLVYADFATGRVETVRPEEDGVPARLRVEAIFHDDDGNLCAVTHNGFYVLDVTDKSILKHYYIDEISYNANNLCSYCIDSFGTIWFGSRGGGINILSPDGVYSRFRDRDENGLDGNIVFGITEDVSTNNIWFSTDDGLYCYDRKSALIEKSKVGSPSLIGALYIRSCFRSSDGDLFFGGTDGFLQFSPDEARTNVHRPKVFLTDLEINNEKSDFKGVGTLVVPYDRSNFEISFSSDSYLYPEKNHYAYRVSGVSEEWSVLPAGQKTVRLFNLHPGRYRFEVIASNNDGLWSDRASVLDFRIKPSPFFSWWTYVLYVIFLSGISVLLYAGRRKIQGLSVELKKLYSRKYIPGPSVIEPSSTDEYILKKAMELVEKNIDNSDYGVEEFVADMSMGRTVLYHKVSELTGMSIKEFILDIRLKRAAQLLSDTDLTISEISYMTGFSNPKYFSTCFKKSFSRTPTDYRAESAEI